MPLAMAPDEPEEVKPNLVINPTPYESQVVETRKEGYDAIATYLAGSKLANIYYQQELGRDSAAASFQADQPLPFGQLIEIKGFEFIVTSPLQIQQNQGDQRGWSATGSAQVYSIVTPNLGDVFIADIGDGRNALFQITSSNRSTFHTESTTVIDFRASFLMTKELEKQIRAKVVRTLTFDRENFRNGVKCLLSEDDVNVNRRLQKAASRLVNLYFRDFFNEQFKTLILPDQTLPTYDPYLANYIKDTVDPHSNPRSTDFVLLGLGGDPMNDQQSLFDVIMERDPDLLYSVAKKMGVADISEYRTRPLFNGIYYSGIQQVVSPRDPRWNTDSPGFEAHCTNDIAEGSYGQDDIRSNLPNLDLTGAADKPAERPLIHPVLIDDYYVLSKAFYEDESGKSALEQQLHNRLNNLAVDVHELASIADAAHTWKNLERFYYIPIVLTLIKLAPGVL